MARLMFIASFNFADDAGNLDRSAKQLKAQTLPYDNGDAEAIVSELLRSGLFIEYEVDGKFFIHIKKFEIHQKIDHPSKSRLPSYNPSLRTHCQIPESSPSPREKFLRKGREGKGSWNGREGKKISVPSEPHSDKSEIERVFDHWKTIWEHPRASLDAKRTATIKKALKGYGADLLCQSISGYRHSPHHTGLNDRNTVYDDIGLLLRDSAHIDAGIRFATDPPNLSSKITQHNVSVLSDWTAPEDEHVADRPIQISGCNGEPRGGLRQGNIQAARESILGRAEGSADRGSPSFGETLDKKR